LPDFNTIASRQLESTTKIYDRTGKTLLFAFREKIRRTEVPLKDISPNLIKSTIAIEDVNFYEHRGLSIRGISRALYTNITTEKQQGGSTITQQVIKNALLTNERTIERKVKEAILAIKLEQTLSKDQIMSMYLNDAPYGGEINGAEEASLYYFGKHAKELDIVESAYLAAIPKNPNLYNPYGNNTDKLEERKNVVLQRMFETGQINSEELERSKNEKVIFVKKEDNNSKAYHFVFFIKDYLEKKYGPEFNTMGLSVKTSLDYELQKELEVLAKNYINNYIAVQQKKNRKVDLSKTNTAVVVLDAKTGQILSMLGSRDYNDEKIDGKFNVATALRQPGSSIKPIVYGTLFEEGLDPETYVFDTPTEFNLNCAPANGTRRDAPCYSPQNYDESFWGPLSLRAQSVPN
jgi:membrane peptidoglycan carboxypeptidase